MDRAHWRERLQGIASTYRETGMWNSRFAGRQQAYLLQALLTTAMLGAVLAVEDVLTNAAVTAAIASTAFVLIMTPRSVVASPRHVIGGHLIAVMVGGLISLLFASSALDSSAGDTRLLIDTSAALSVGIGIVLMGLTNTEHPPAAGTALGMVLGGFSWVVVIVLMSSVLVMTIVQRLMLPYLKDAGVKCYDRQSFD